MSKGNGIFKIDAAMIPVFTVLIITGIAVHISSGKDARDLWVIRSVIHVVAAVVFLILVYCHVMHHRGWFRSLFNGNTKRRGVTIALTLILIVEIITGIVLLVFVDGGGSPCGHLHWIAGIILAVIGTGHYIKRFNRLKNGLVRKHN